MPVPENRFGTALAGERPPAIPVETREPFTFVHINKCGGSGVEIALGLPKNHQTAAQLRDEIGAEDWAKRFTFSIVRNPFDRAVSIYFYRVRTGQSGLEDRQLNVNQWIDRVWSDEDSDYFGASALIAPCFDWLSDGDDLIVEDVLKLEDLDREWDRIAKRLAVNVHPGVVNANSHPAYRDLLDPVSRKTLERAFAKDIDRFEYRY